MRTGLVLDEHHLQSLVGQEWGTGMEAHRGRLDVENRGQYQPRRRQLGTEQQGLPCSVHQAAIEADDDERRVGDVCESQEAVLRELAQLLTDLPFGIRPTR